MTGTATTASDAATNVSMSGAAPSALRVLRAADDDLISRYAEPFAPRLSASIARHLEVDAAAIVAGCGSDDLIDAGFRALAAPGDRLAMLTPTFETAASFGRSNRLALRGIPWPPATTPDRAALVDGDPALIYLCSPNNPTGAVLPTGFVEQVLERSTGIVVLDEAYVEFGGASLAARAPDLGRMVVLRTFSKAWGLAGLRIGYAVGAPDLVSRIRAVLGPYKVNALAEAAAIAALEGDQRWMEESVAATTRERERLIAALRAIGREPVPSAANFVMLPVRDAAATRDHLLQRGVLVRAFRALEGMGDAIRISVGPAPAMLAVVAALAEEPA